LAGVETDERGHVRVNERLQTTAKDVWAVGDCAGSPYFTHIGSDDFRVVLANLTGGNRVTTGRQVPFCLFTDPELARVGLSEAEAKERGIAYRLAKIPMPNVMRARTLSETRGFWKALIEQDGDRILAFTGVRRRGRGSHGRRPGRDGGRAALHGAAGHDPDAPDHRRRAHRALFRRACQGMIEPVTAADRLIRRVIRECGRSLPPDRSHARSSRAVLFLFTEARQSASDSSIADQTSGGFSLNSSRSRVVSSVVCAGANNLG
jgi:hypothetical protein